MIKNIRSAALAMFLCISGAAAQVVPSSRITDWSEAGLLDTVPSYSNVVNILNYGGNGNGTTLNDAAIQSAISALNGLPGVVYFPTGTYMFSQPVDLADNTVLRGAGKDSAKLRFDLGGAFQNMINIAGITDPNNSWDVTQPAAKNDSTLTLNTATGLAIGDWVQIYGNDSSIIFDSWAYKTVGQIFMIKNVNGNTITIDRKLRKNYPLSFTPRLKRIVPTSGCGIECLYLERIDSTAAQTYNINMTNAVNCWVIGVESNLTNFAHVGITGCANILVRGNYFHHSHGYGGSGNGYGVALQYTSGDCLVDNNRFEHLRHSMLVQAGANGNVLAYNYSKDPNWTEPNLPANAAGDAVLHGNYAYLNLFEGNIVQNMVIDNAHGINGPYNTYFRNRGELFGIFQNTGTGVTDSMNYIGNEVTNTNLNFGFYNVTGTGRFEYGNIIKGTITPAGTLQLTEKSLYLASPPPFWDAHLPWPGIGYLNTFNQGTNTAKLNYDNGVYTDCRLNPHYVGVNTVHKDVAVKVYPNPAKDRIVFEYGQQENVVVILTDIIGRAMQPEILYHAKGKTILATNGLPPGIYLYRLQNTAGILASGKIAVE